MQQQQQQQQQFSYHCKPALSQQKNYHYNSVLSRMHTVFKLVNYFFSLLAVLHTQQLFSFPRHYNDTSFVVVVFVVAVLVVFVMMVLLLNVLS